MAILEIKEVIPGSFVLRDARDWEARASTLAASDPDTCDQLARFFYRVSRQLKEIAQEMRLVLCQISFLGIPAGSAASASRGLTAA